MGIEIAIAVGAVLLLIGIFWFLTRQPHPSDPMEAIGGEDDDGPTGDAYPPGSRPAGPGAESQEPETDPGRP